MTTCRVSLVYTLQYRVKVVRPAVVWSTPLKWISEIFHRQLLNETRCNTHYWFLGLDHVVCLILSEIYADITVAISTVNSCTLH